MKFEDIKYERLNFKEIKKKAIAYEKAFRNAKSYEEQKKIGDEIDKFMADDIFTTISYVHIKNTIDTSDKFYEDEYKYYNKKFASLIGVSRKLSKDYVNSPYKEEYIKNGYGIKIKSNEVSLRQQTFKTIFLNIKESNLKLAYSKTVAQAKTNFRGKDLNFYGLLKEMQDPSREVRKEALFAWANLYESIAPKLDEIYDQLIKNRCKQAKLLKYDDYVSQVYDARGIYDYNREDLKKFKDNVVKYIVPVCMKLAEEQKERLEVDHLYYYDQMLFYKEGAMVPRGSTSELIEKANEMYNELSKETGEFFTFMKENNYFDLETKDNKRGGGYCTSLPKYKAPFIFSNFNQTSADVDVLTHEAGHAFAAYTGFHSEKDIYAQDNMTMDIAEVHSMSMEHFAYPYMEKFFGEDAAKYRLMHLEQAITTIPYLCAVDEFQHQVFAKSNTKHVVSAEERRKIWHEIEERFLPDRDYGDIDFLKQGGFWMQKQHIFLFPFYYIDYALAQMSAFQFYKKETINHEDAWKDYYKLCQIAGKQGYFDTLKAVNIKSPFEEETIKEVVEFVCERIEALKKEVK